MMNIKSNQGLILDHLPDEYISNSSEQNSVNEKSLLSPQEVAAKIWDQWKQCRLLHVQLTYPFESLKNNRD
jgi:hypothetical protein